MSIHLRNKTRFSSQNSLLPNLGISTYNFDILTLSYKWDVNKNSSPTLFTYYADCYNSDMVMVRLLYCSLCMLQELQYSYLNQRLFGMVKLLFSPDEGSLFRLYPRQLAATEEARLKEELFSLSIPCLPTLEVI